MNQPLTPSPNDFPSGAMISTGLGHRHQDRRILYASDYFYDELGFDRGSLTDASLSDLLTRASTVMFDSYILPMLLHDQSCSEVLLELSPPGRSKIPVLVNTRVCKQGNGHLIHWSIADATQRNRLYQELLDTRRMLEAQSERLHGLSITDELTGLMNRREMMRRLEVQYSRAYAQGQCLAVLMFDLDLFKAINDTQGHLEGDRILSELGRLLQAEARASDIIARYGGEEFIIIAPDADEDSAWRLAERLHALVSRIAVKGGGLTVSIGVSLSDPRQRVSPQELIERADKALYQAKAEGRNRSVFYSTGEVSA